MTTQFRRVTNPVNKFTAQILDWEEQPQLPAVEVFEEEAKSIISRNDSPDIGFRFSVNPYRGCFHGCSYCYARPSHQYLDWGAGVDFERKIIVKTNAAELLEREFLHRAWEGGTVVFSGNTDCYQPLEAHYELTRKLLQVCVRFQNPVSIITKGTLIRRDIELLQELASRAHLDVFVSLAFSDDEMCRKIEPFTPVPSARFRVIRALAEAGVSVGIGLAPVIPGLNDTQIPEILTRAREAGAKRAFMTLLRLPAEVKPVFIEQLEANFPDRAKKIINGITRMKEGALNRSAFGKRMRGDGPEWDAVEWLFESTCEKLGLNQEPERVMTVSAKEAKKTFRRPQEQLNLFE